MDKELIKAAFSQIDDSITPSDFHEDWRSASRSAERSRDAKAGSPGLPHRLTKNIATLSPALVTVIIGSMIGVLAVMLNLEMLKKEPGPDIARDRESVMLPDAGAIWHAPSDDLLYTDVLRYERQRVTFATYDPITMEIR